MLKNIILLLIATKMKEESDNTGGVTVDYLETNNNYDIVLVTARPIVIVPFLINVIGIPVEKIRVYQYELACDSEARMLFQGQHLEDSVILLLCSMLKMDITQLKYLEIGVHDPIIGSNSWVLYSLGMRGVLVDALSQVNTLVKMVRSEDVFLNFAVTYDKNSKDNMKFYTNNFGGLSSLSKEWLKFAGINDDDIREITVPCIYINDLLEKVGFCPDILLLDVEGYDERILRSIKYEQFRPSIIMSEIGEPTRELISFMAECGYALYTVIKKLNVVFIKKDKFIFNKG